MTEPEKLAPSTTNGSQGKDSFRSGKSYKWVSKCGVQLPTKRAIHAHQKECPVCMSMIHSGPSSGKERVMYCGEVVRTRKKASEHFQHCSACQELRRQVRIKTCKDLEHTPEMRLKYSETAKKTSKRTDIQEDRAARLRAWREQNPEKFAAIRDKAHGSPKRSNMEAWLEPHLKVVGFTRSARLTCGNTRKQVDFFNRGMRMVIEVDGPWHFLPIRSPDGLHKVQTRDRMLDREILKRSWRLIRLSMECFKSNGELISPSLEQLLGGIADGTWDGILCFGSLYESVSWDGIKVTISK